MKVQSAIKEKLENNLNPDHMEIENESHMHSVPPNSETHFKVTIVSSAFENLRSVQRHQKVYGVLQEELAGAVHALALHTYSPKEWSEQPNVASSPVCAGGGRES